MPQTGLLEPFPCSFFPLLCPFPLLPHVPDCCLCIFDFVSLSLCADMEEVWSSGLHRASECCLNKHFYTFNENSVSVYLSLSSTYCFLFNTQLLPIFFQSNKKRQRGLSIGKRHISHVVSNFQLIFSALCQKAGILCFDDCLDRSFMPFFFCQILLVPTLFVLTE